MKKRFLTFLVTLALVLQPFMSFAAKVYELDCTSTGCSDTVQSVAVSAAVASTRNRVNASGNLESVAANTVRTDYADSKWWMMGEGMGVNYVLYSQTDTQTTAMRSTKTGSQTDPFGATNAWKIVEDDTATSSHYNYWDISKVSHAAIPDNTTITVSTYVKKGVTSRDWIRLVFLDKAGTARGMHFNLNTDATGTAVGGATGGFDSNPPAGWDRVYVVYSCGTGASGISLIVYLGEADNDVSFTGTPLTYPDGITVFGGQIEVGSYPTSYTPTNGAIGIRASEEGAVDTTDIATATATIANGAMFSFAAGASFAYMDNLNLAQYVKSGNKYRIKLTDGAAKTATAFIYAADTGYVVSVTELVTNGDMELDSNWADYNTPTTNERSSEQAHGGTYSRKIVAPTGEARGAISDNASFIAGGLYLVSAWIYNSADTGTLVRDNSAILPFILASTGNGAWEQLTNRYVALATGTMKVRFQSDGTGASTFYGDDLSVKQITNVATTGVRVVTATGGSTEGWTVDAGFNYNSATYAVVIEFVEINGYYQPMASLFGGDGWDAGTDMDTAGTMVLDFWPGTAQSTYPVLGSGLIGIINSTGSLLYTSSSNITSVDGSVYNNFQAGWSTAINHKIALTWATGANQELYQDGIKGTDATRSYDGDWSLGTNLVFFFGNGMPTRIRGLTFWDEAAGDFVAQTSGDDSEVNYVLIAPATLYIRGLNVRAGDTGTVIRHVTGGNDNILSCLICLEESAEAYNTLLWTSGSAANLAVATTKTASGSNNFFSDPAMSGAGAESFTAEYWSQPDPFVSYSTGNFLLSKSARNAINKGINLCAGVDDPFVGCTGVGTGTWVDLDGNTVPNKVIPDVGAYEYTSSRSTWRILFGEFPPFIFLEE